jgi:uncharacterized protein YycO
MQRTIFASVLMAAALLASPLVRGGEPAWEATVGDIVFQTSGSVQSQAVQEATGSKWSHVGMVIAGEDGPQIVEAVQPVQIIPLKEFLAHGKSGSYEVYRLKASIADPRALTEAATKLVGNDYDPYFQWSDDLIYCSELVWKAYERGLGIKLSEPRSVSDFDLTHPSVQKLIRQRFPEGMPPDVAVSPQDLADSKLVERVAKR